jgi:hypothetical protein
VPVGFAIQPVRVSHGDLQVIPDAPLGVVALIVLMTCTNCVIGGTLAPALYTIVSSTGPLITDIAQDPLLPLAGIPAVSSGGVALDEDRVPQGEFGHGGDRSPSCGTSAPARVSIGEGDSPSRSSTSQAIFQHRVAGGRGCQGEACQ